MLVDLRMMTGRSVPHGRKHVTSQPREEIIVAYRRSTGEFIIAGGKPTTRFTQFLNFKADALRGRRTGALGPATMKDGERGARMNRSNIMTQAYT